MRKIKISVIIPVFNAEMFLKRAVSSALDQKEVKEVLLIEDNSNDDSLKLCESLEQEFEQVHLYRHQGGINKGAGASRNLGINKSRGEFIAFLDADDFYKPDRFKKDAELFNNFE
ncbi:glycosyltransferase family 2 protein [Lutimonas zeaxanthinifaciens]|uniref:glycosyltransferase family 2 protein n=1 Tax=Lutimonas zeaxanthinifaciens TaxID=3060215 RepID=UPI00265C8D9B|nr:glycosyltransferase family 2 protein [Lutimonas sp. YSD2104]WKK67348.1 glycosyltransferase family 2 protein [Lutimonas sp. YSD2104]